MLFGVCVCVGGDAGGRETGRAGGGGIALSDCGLGVFGADGAGFWSDRGLGVSGGLGPAGGAGTGTPAFCFFSFSFSLVLLSRMPSGARGGERSLSFDCLSALGAMF